MLKFLISICLLMTINKMVAQNEKRTPGPLKVAVIGLVHTHVHWILGREKTGDIDIIAIVEPNRQLAEQYSKQHGYSMKIVYNSMEEMINSVQPEAVCAFNSTYDHLKTVEFFAPLGIHIMVEKPLAVNNEHATTMLALAKKHSILLLTNYETTWYGSNKVAWEMVHEKKEIGDIKKIVFHTGHPGPVEIGCNPEFLEWLTDPVLNGGGALTDFGCYGANIATWLMKGERPVSVSATLQQLKPTVYPKVEDEATVVLAYKDAQVIIQASWNWPFNRKDMVIYGKDGYVFCIDRENMVMMKNGKKLQDTIKAAPLPTPYNDPFSYLANVVRGLIKPAEYDLSAPANNKIVMQILQAAKQAATTGKTIIWKEFFKE
jgi:predicted dehydrogenase